MPQKTILNAVAGVRGLLRLLAFALLLGGASYAHAAAFCSSFPLDPSGTYHVVDGNTLTPATLPSSIGIDVNCEFKNFPQNWAGGTSGLTSTINFKQTTPAALAIFSNVWYSGNMACSNTNAMVWFVNSYFSGNNQCQSIFIAVPAAFKVAPTTASVGVPFTYDITVPTLFSYNSLGNPVYVNQPYTNNIYGVTVYDDISSLTNGGAVLTYLGATADVYTNGALTSSGVPLTANGLSGAQLNQLGLPSTAPEDSTHLYFSSLNPANTLLNTIPAGSQVVIHVQVVLANNAANTPGLTFYNTAQFWLAENINGTLYTPLPGQGSQTVPTQIVGPNLTLQKSATTANLNLTSADTFTLNVQNTGGGAAWNTTIVDLLPTGMCSSFPPTNGPITAKVFDATGTNLIKTLTLGTDYTAGISSCTLTFQLANTANASIPATDRLMITYQAQFDTSGITAGQVYTNYAGATQYTSGPTGGAYSPEVVYNTITNGTPGTLDFQDTFNVTAAVSGYYYLKSVADLTTGQNPATQAFPGDVLQYTFQLQNYTLPTLSNVFGTDNFSSAFVPGTLALVAGSSTMPAGTLTINSTGGPNGTGSITVGCSTSNCLSLTSTQPYTFQVTAQLSPTVANGTVVSNQGALQGIDSSTNSPLTGFSDNPFVNGIVLFNSTAPAPDATSLTVVAPQPLTKATTQLKATIGDQYTFQITVPVSATKIPLYDVSIYDNLTAAAIGADMTFVSATAQLYDTSSGAPVASGSPLTMSNMGTASSLILQNTATGLDIPVAGYAVITLTAKLSNTTNNVAGKTITNSAYYTYDKLNGNPATAGTTPLVAATSSTTVVEPVLSIAKTVAPVSPAVSPVKAGDVLQYTVTITNNGTSTAHDLDVLDPWPSNLSAPTGATATVSGATSGGYGTYAPLGAVSGFIATPTLLANGAYVWGAQNGDTSLYIGAGQTLTLTFQATVQWTNGSPISNAAYTDWTSLGGAVAGERNGAGCPNVTAPNTYCWLTPTPATIATFDPTALTKAVTSDTWTTAPSTATDSTLRAGDLVNYTLNVTLGSGTTQNVVLTDTLPANMAFDHVVSVNGVANPGPYNSAGSFTYNTFSGPTLSASNTVSTWNFGNITNTTTGNSVFTIVYAARVLNTVTQSAAATTFNNAAQLSYALGGVAKTTPVATAPVYLDQPYLGITKTSLPTSGSTVVANQAVTYTVTLTNTGLAPAYNTAVQDTLPAGMCQTAPTVTSVTVGATTLTSGTDYSASWTGATCTLTVSMLTTAAAIPPNGGSLAVTYQAKTDTTLGTGVTLSNSALANYYSLDSSDANAAFRKLYTTTTASSSLNTASPGVLSKVPNVTQAAIGQPFSYTITVPGTALGTALYNVHVHDDISLATTTVSLNYISATAALYDNTGTATGKTWTLTNAGTATALDLYDATPGGGVDIPAGYTVKVTLTLALASDPTNNTIGKQFQNTAWYTYTSTKASTTQVSTAKVVSTAVTIVGPYLQMTKSGPATMNVGQVYTFTLAAKNTGLATAWKPVITDLVPNTATGGMCGTAPANVTASVGGTTLTSGTDFTVAWAAAPTCTLTVSILTSAASVPAGATLTVTYQGQLDAGTASSLALTNIAGATQWLTTNPAVAGATPATNSNTLTDGTPTVLTDFQSALPIMTAAPVLTFNKTVIDQTTGSATSANPGDTLKYTLTLTNTSAVNATNFSLTDTLDALNSPADFVPATLKLTSTLPGAATATVTGNSLSITGLNVAAGATVTITFTAQLVSPINNGTTVLNQAQITGGNISTQLSAVTGATPAPTPITITSAPAWQVLKTVKDITSGANVVAAGDVLQYTITVKNIGTENAQPVTLTDAIPNFTTYVAGTTTMNGVTVADPAAGVSALQNGMVIHAANTPTAGLMPANASAAYTGNVATITFQVKISTTVLSGTIISNQGFVNGSGATSGTFAAAPSDDPTTPALNDPTRVIIGNLPLLYATKTVALAVDVNGNGVIDPGDTVRYTITVANSGSAPATGVTLTDATPLNTAYVANTTFLNGAGVGQPDGGVSPLGAGVGINSPGAAAGTIAPKGQAVVTFEVQVSGAVAGGTVISNQGSITSGQLPTLQTDADGNPSNGYQATTFVVGSAQQVSITKQVTVVGGGSALPGSQLDYVVQVTNTGTVAATNVVITDDLSTAPLASQVSYVAGSATLNASTAGVTVSGSVITANYGTTYGSLAPGGTATLHFRATIASGLATGTQITNTGLVAWNNPALTATASASISVGGTPGSATLSGHLWYDANFNSVADAGELNLAGWTIGVYRNNTLLGTVLSDVNGLYSIPGLAPTTTTADQYTLQFTAPGASATTAKLGRGLSAFTNGMQQISGIAASSGSIVPNLDLPINPNGVVYNSILRTPVPGARLSLVKTGSTVPVQPACFDDPAQQGQVTTASGYYKFDLNFSDPSCPSGASYLIQVTPPVTYLAGPSVMIPPATSAATPAFSVPTCPGTPTDAIPATTNECEASTSAGAPGLNIAANTAGTNYYLNLLFDNTLIPGHSEIFDNPIPLDPQMGNAVMISKTAAKQNVSKGDLIPYTITVNNTMAVNLSNMSVVDSFPPGFKYVAGSGRLDGQPVEPVVNAAARQLTWGKLQLATNTKRVIQLMLIVGAGVGEGKYVNRAQVFNATTGSAASPVAEATVRVVADPTLDCSDVIGKVFDDANLNGYQDDGEKGLPGVRIATVNGLIVTTDKYGRFHIACAVVPDPDRGSNYILKIDERSLPSGYRMTTENPRVERATRGKMLKFNFGAAIHRVVKMDMFDGVFEPGKTSLRVEWQPRIGLLINELKKAPSTLRLTYYAETENAGLVDDRLRAIKQEIVDAWKKESGNYDLTVETEVFWRTGGPPSGRGDTETPPASDDAEDSQAPGDASGAKAPAQKGGQ
jgi:uncharacterized repeat protein (TIGR01451 family)/fimbrial isopeptide formation D2 family protein